MQAKGYFEVTLNPANDQIAPAGRMLIEKTYHGDLRGSAVGQMLSKRTDEGVAVYSAIEEFSGVLDGKTGTFTLSHYGIMSAQGQELKIEIIPSSGTDELKGITGSLELIMEGGVHNYTLNYHIDAPATK